LGLGASWTDIVIPPTKVEHVCFILSTNSVDEAMS
jgi:hypothetical protein